MKLSTTVGLAVAVSPAAGTVAALAQISGAATAKMVDAARHLRVPADYRTFTKRSGAGRLPATAAKARSQCTLVESGKLVWQAMR